MFENLSFKALEATRRWITNAARRRAPHLSPRRWSNAELRKWGPLFTGSVVNVSAWKDLDKEGGRYRDYFPNASEYAMTNYWGSEVPNDGHPDAIFLDLEADLPPEMRGRFDVVLAHTVLEHVFDFNRAFENLASLTRDILIVVLPFAQDEHYGGDLFGDYWRVTPLCLKRMSEKNGLKLVHVTSNDNPWYPIYLLGIASRNPDRWRGIFPPIDWQRRIGREVYVFKGAAW